MAQTIEVYHSHSLVKSVIIGDKKKSSKLKGKKQEKREREREGENVLHSNKPLNAKSSSSSMCSSLP